MAPGASLASPASYHDGMPPADEPRSPQSGAVDWLALSESVLPLERAQAWAVTPDCGAVVAFTGTVRDHSVGRPGVVQLDYEAYEEYVTPVLAQVADLVRGRVDGVGRLVLWHRVGSLVPTDAAVLVVASAPHRDGAFEAARLAIDLVKERSPIWKREHWSGGVDWGRCDHAAEVGS